MIRVQKFKFVGGYAIVDFLDVNGKPVKTI